MSGEPEKMLEAEMERMRPVVEAAREWANITGQLAENSAATRLARAVDTYEKEQ